MNQPRTSRDVLDSDFLVIRSKILELAACLDRLDRSAELPGSPPDRRVAQIRAALESLSVPEPGRAETVQHIFSLEYDPGWRARFEIDAGRKA